MTTITGNARFREAVAARLVLAMRPDQSIADTALPDAQSSPTPGDYSIQVDTHQVLLQAHAFDPADLIGPWRAETVYAVGDVIFETRIDADALVLECTAVAGTEETGTTEPTWDTTPGNTTTDNDVTWETLGTISELSPLTQFLYQAVLLSAVTPATGSVDGGTSVSLSGSGLSAFNAGNGDTITVDGNAATNISVVSDTEITFDTPASDGGAAGSVDVVMAIGGESVTLTAGFEYTEEVWTPADTTSALWLKGNDSDTITLDGSSNVEQWDDKSGNSRHATQSSSGSRPPLTTLNGIQAPQFDNTLMNVPQLPAGNYTLFFVSGCDSKANVSLVGSGNDSYVPIAASSGGSNTDIIRINGTNDPTDSYVLINGEETQSVTTRSGVHSALVGTGAVLSVFGEIPQISTAWEIGRGGGSGSWYWNGPIAEIVVVAGEPTTELRQKIEGYLAHEWGIASKLPSGHPYKNSPP